MQGGRGIVGGGPTIRRARGEAAGARGSFGGIIAERVYNLTVGTPIEDRIPATSLKIIRTTSDAARYRAKFDESGWIELIFNSFVSPGFKFDRVLIESTIGNPTISVQYGADFIG